MGRPSSYVRHVGRAGSHPVTPTTLRQFIRFLSGTAPHTEKKGVSSYGTRLRCLRGAFAGDRSSSLEFQYSTYFSYAHSEIGKER
jgi:hypothetical protein